MGTIIMSTIRERDSFRNTFTFARRDFRTYGLTSVNISRIAITFAVPYQKFRIYVK